MDLVYQIVCEIAERESVDPVDLKPSLNEAVDVDVLEVLTTDTEYRQEGLDQSVEFVYYGYTVDIDGTGSVSISEHTGTADDVSSEKSTDLPKRLSAETDHQEGALKRVTDVIAARERPFERRLDGLLEDVRKTLGVESATLSYVDDSSYVFEAVDTTTNAEFQAGKIIPLADTACQRVVQTEQSLVVKNLEDEAPELANPASGITSYIGVPVFVDGEVYGTFCFYDTEERDEEFSEWDLAFVELLSNWVSTELEQRQRERSLHAHTTERPYSQC